MPISLSLMQIFLGVGGIVWLLQILIQKKQFQMHPVFPYLLIFALFSLISIFFSLDPVSSLKLIKKLPLILVPVFFFNILDREEYIHRFLITLYIGAAVNSVWGLIMYHIGKEHRLSGFMGHYMTTAGILMMLIVILLAEMLTKGIADFGFRKTMIFLILSTALFYTLTRNAWVGVFVGFLLSFSFIRPRYVPLGMVLLLITFLILPATVKQRLASTFDIQDTTIQERLKMIRTGNNIIADNPVWGVGPEMVPRVYDEYKNEKEDISRPHLHNNFYQIAAERGLITLTFWIAFLYAIIHFCWRIYIRFKDSDMIYPKFLSIGIIVMVISFLLAGLFEYNWGDTEVAVVFLFLVTLPFIFGHKTLKDCNNEN